mmetsp:Transcript_2177/g.3408  ORF Transcript_2177/g.3408 Transcript_2177/m.3408 type:complete len:222 (+) Transcript_2177:302-967(+)
MITPEVEITIDMAEKIRDSAKSTSSNHHIRFDDEGSDDAVVENSSLSNAAPPPISSASVASASNQNPKNNKRKCKHATPKDDSDTPSSDKILNGLIVAISALESKHVKEDTNNKDEDDQYQNYKTLKNVLLKSLGATISPQVHKRVHYLISTENAIQNLTQRVRQALKRNVDIVDVAWVKQCSEQKMRLAVDNNYSSNYELANCLMIEREKEKKRQKVVSK